MFHPLRLLMAIASVTLAFGPRLRRFRNQHLHHSGHHSIPDDLTPEQVDDLVARMSDDQVRAILLERLDAVAEAKRPPNLQEKTRRSDHELQRNLGRNGGILDPCNLVTVPNIFSAAGTRISATFSGPLAA